MDISRNSTASPADERYFRSPYYLDTGRNSTGSPTPNLDTSRSTNGSPGDERNFRSSYYEKVGFKSVEEKKSLELLLKEKPLDVLKLKLFCLRFSIPGSYRNMLWKILLGVIPLNTDNYKFVLEQRSDEFSELQRTLKFLGISSDKTLRSHLFLLMWLLHTGKLKFDWRSQIDCNPSRYFISIIETLCRMFDSDIDIYLIAKGFFNCVEKFYFDIPKLVDCIKTHLEKDDIQLYTHLEKIGGLEKLPVEQWLFSCFSGVISDTSLCRILDKVACGSSKILVFVSVALLTSSRRTLFSCITVEAASKSLNFVTEEVSEIVTWKAIEKWQQNGSLLSVGPENKTNAYKLKARLVKGLW